MEVETIVAPATPKGRSAIAGIRVSGPQALGIARKFFSPLAAGSAAQNIPPFSPILGKIVDNGEVVDEVILIYYRAPRSYTREDMIELFCHGNWIIVERIVDCFIREGARLAEPGEFTMRALLNGRIDLTQAQAVMSIINATSNIALRVGMKQLQGELSRRVEDIREELMHVLAYLEADINFPEDVALETDGFREGLAEGLDRVVVSIDKMISGARAYALIEEGVNCLLLGYSNVGKSMLFNRLLGRDRSIVYDTKGTTRDSISEKVRFGAADVVLWDTAGILKDVEGVDAVAVERTQEALSSAQIVVLVLEAGRELNEVELEIFSRLEDRSVIVFLNKADLHRDVEVPASVRSKGWDCVVGSALKGEGVEELKRLIGSYAERFVVALDDFFILRKSQVVLLEELKSLLLSARKLLLQGEPTEMAAEEIREAISRIDRLLGRDMDEDLLNLVFSEFCIGK